MSDSDIEDLDISWIEEHEKEIQINKNYNKERMKTIQTKFIYMNTHEEIEKITFCETPIQTNSTGEGYISKSHIMEIVQKRRNMFENKKYAVFDIFSYVIDLDSKGVQTYSNAEESYSKISEQFLKKHTVFNDIIIEDSIFIFHKINTLYFIFKEKIQTNNQREKDKQHIKSILKNKTNKHGEETHKNKKNNITKKVYFVETG